MMIPVLALFYAAIAIFLFITGDADAGFPPIAYVALAAAIYLIGIQAIISELRKKDRK